ncbi:DUF6273 domain-containing protein [Anaerotruncus rubiinfantis]|uniref:DUF6273 domain-containing protein n=1 Tax=Anaerotruncus rubiinfantis TaxID=1720200 RepID=UPI003D7AF92C
MSDIKGKTLSFGGINTRDLAPQVENLTLKGGDGKIDATFSAVAEAYASLVKYYVVTANTHMPSGPSDGVSVMVLPGTGTLSCVLSGLTNGVAHHVRVFIRCTYGWQTSPMAYGVATPLAGIAISTLAVGGEVKLNLGGVAYNHLVVHQGNPDTALYDASCNGAWLLIKDIYNQIAWTTNGKGDYSLTTSLSYLNTTYFGLFDPNIQTSIKQIKIPYVAGNAKPGVVKFGEEGVSCRLFWLSAIEVGFNYNSTDPMRDGAKLDYFDLTGNSVGNAKRIGLLNGAAYSWLLRSGLTSLTGYFLISETGTLNSAGTSSTARGSRPALILPPDFRLNPEPNPDGSYSPL